MSPYTEGSPALPGCGIAQCCPAGVTQELLSGGAVCGVAWSAALCERWDYLEPLMSGCSQLG